MPRTAIIVTAAARNGSIILPAAQAVDAANGMDVPAGIDGKLILSVINGSAATRTVTVKARSGVAGDDLVVQIATLTTKLIGPLESAKYEFADEKFRVDFDSAATVTMNAIKLP